MSTMDLLQSNKVPGVDKSSIQFPWHSQQIRAYEKTPAQA